MVSGFSFQNEDKIEYSPNPFAQEDEEGEIASVCYKYDLKHKCRLLFIFVTN